MEKCDSLALGLLAAKLIREAHTDGYNPPYDLYVSDATGTAILTATLDLALPLTSKDAEATLKRAVRPLRITIQAADGRMWTTSGG
jgi:hypothetical protein